MKPVPANARVGEAARQSERLGEIRLRAVEGRVEAGDLGNLRRALHDRADRREVVRLMQGRERLEFREIIEHRLCNPYRLDIVEAAMDDAVTEGDNRSLLQQGAPGRRDLAHGRGMIVGLWLEAALLDDRAFGVEDVETRFDADPL